MKSYTNFPNGGGSSPARAAKLAVLIALLAVLPAAGPCQAQLLQKIEQGLLGGQQQQQQLPGMAGLEAPQQANFVGNVNLPQGQYLMTNVQTSQAFYVTVQNGGMYLSNQPAPNAMAQPGMMPGMMPGMQQQQPGGLGGLMKGGLGNFLKNELAPQQQQMLPNQQ